MIACHRKYGADRKLNKADKRGAEQLSGEDVARLGADDERFHYAGGLFTRHTGSDAIAVKIDRKEHQHQHNDSGDIARKTHRPQRQRGAPELRGGKCNHVVAHTVFGKQRSNVALIERINDACGIGKRTLIQIDEGRSVPLDHLNDQR